MRFVLCFRYGVLYHKTLGIPDCVPTPAPEYVLTAVIPSDLFLAPIGTPAGKLNFRGRKKRLFFFAFQFLGMWHYISIILFGCAWKVQIKGFFFCFLDKKMSPKEFRPLFPIEVGPFCL